MHPIRLCLSIWPALAAAPALALDCPRLPEQVSRDTEVEVRVGVAQLGQARGGELASRTRRLTTDLLGRLPQADRVYLEQMLFAAYCSSLRDNAALAEAERSARIAAYGREVRSALAGPPPAAGAPAARPDPRDAARAELARLPMAYTADAFVAAAQRGDARVVTLFIAAGLDVKAVDGDGETALAHAAHRGDLPMLQALLKAGAPVEQPVGREGSALSWAAGAGRIDALRLLLARRPGRDTVERAFEVAATAGQPEALDLLAAQGVDLATHGPEALWRSAGGAAFGERAGRLAVIRHLLAAGVPVDAVEPGGRTLLVYAVMARAADVVRLALDAGADAKRRCECNGYLEGGYTPLAIAARQADVETAALLLERGADASTPTASGRSPLHLAAEASGEDALRVVDLLLAHRAEVDAADALGVTPLNLAAAGSPACVRRLLGAGAKVDAAGHDGFTPLMAAAWRGDVESMRALLDAGAAVDLRTASGRTALAFAARRGQPEAARLLLERRARADLADGDGKTALAHARDLDDGSVRSRLVSLLSATGASSP